MADFEIKANDTLPVLTATLKADGAPYDLTGCTVYLILQNASTQAYMVNRQTMTIVSAANGQVSYDFTAIESANAGSYNGEIEIDDAGEVLTFPTDGYFTLDVNADLG